MKAFATTSILLTLTAPALSVAVSFVPSGSPSIPSGVPTTGTSIPGFSFFNLSSKCSLALTSLETTLRSSTGIHTDSTYTDLLTSFSSGKFNITGLLKSGLDSFCGSIGNWTAPIHQAASDIKTNCSQEIQNDPLGIPGITYLALELYDPLSEVACSKSSSGSYCVIETFSNFVDYFAPVLNTLDNFSLENAAITTLPMSTSNTLPMSTNNFNATELLNLFNNLPVNITCTTCNANILDVFNKFFKNHTDILPSNLTLGLSEVNLAVNSKCGSSWAATANGSSTTTTSTNSVTGSANIASSSLVYTTVVAGVVVAIVNILFL